MLIPLPNPLFNLPYATTLSSEDGTLLSASIAADEQWRFAPIDSIPEKFEQAILTYEDEYFYYHPGINPVSFFRAIYQNISAGKVVSGGSTLTMQTIRMALGNQKRTYFQKIKEIFISLKLEIRFSKYEILTSYANHAPFGGNIVGLNAAAWRYYGRSPYQLSWSEIATLAILPNNPGEIYPGKNEERLYEKRNFLLEKLNKKGVIDEETYFLAKQERIPTQTKPLPNYAYHLLHRAIKDGHEGENVRSSLNANWQYSAKRILERHSRELSKNEIHNAAAVIIEIATGEAKAYIGNSETGGFHGQHVDIITAQRSPGSLLKPFLYGLAIDRGIIAPKQLLPDIPLFYKGFAPKNFDKKFRGAVPANESLASSLNVPFVHLLIKYGYEDFHKQLLNIGFQSFVNNANHYGLSIILGGADSNMWELTSAYSGLVRVFTRFFDRPVGRSYTLSDYFFNSYLPNKEIENHGGFSEQGIMQAESIRYIIESLQVVERPNEESGWEQFSSERKIAWKTGTSYGHRDAWAIGFDGRHLVGVWTGNADGEGRAGLTGVRTSAPILFEIFGLLPNAILLQNDEAMGNNISICNLSGMIAGEFCDNTSSTRLPEFMQQNGRCNYHDQIHLDSVGQSQVNSSCYPISKMRTENWFVLPPVQAWYYRQYHSNYKSLPDFMPGCTVASSKQTRLDLVYPHLSAKVYIPKEQDGAQGQTIFEAAHDNPEAIIYWHLDEEFLGQTQRLHQMGISTTAGPHQITLIDEAGNELKRNFVVTNDQ